MFDFVRKHNKLFQIILVLLILPSFIFLGVQSSDLGGGGDVVAKVGSQKIMQAELDNAVRTMAERVRSQQPDTDAALFDTPEFKQRALDALIHDYTLNAAAYDQRVRASDSRLQRIFATSPDFAPFRNADGTINSQLLEAQGISSAQFAERLRQQITVSQVIGGVENTGTVSKVANRLAVEALFQVREVQWRKFEPKAYAAQLNPTPEQLRKFFDEPAMSAAFREPEHADVQYVVLDLDSLKSRVSVSEDDLRKSYEQNIKNYTQPEERRASHILVKAEKSAPAADRQAAKAKAEKLLAELRKNPAQFAELARKNSEDPGSAANGGDLEFFGRGNMTKPFEDAVFSLKKGQISDVVESDFGYHIIELTDLRGGQAQPFEAVRAQIEDDARKQLAQRLYADAADKFTNIVYEQSDSLKPVADELKLTVQTASNVLRNPGAKDQGVLGNTRLLQALFDPANRSKARNTEAIEAGPSKLVSARIVKYYPDAKPPFEQVEAKVRERWITRESVRAARLDAEQKLAAWKQAPDKADLPAAVQMSRRLVFSQPPAVLDAALRLPEKQLPAWQVVDLGDEGFALIKVNKVLPLQIVPEEEKATQTQFTNYWAKAEAEAYLKALQREYKTKVLKPQVTDAAKAGDKSASGG
ncbi:peptidyl-prolyl cis-trans isomerase [Aquabacterium soli]|uniref:Periplasmic chaperone PpiD n=1 Tax=Aquabacterium soli TaxID=2493092 RepID=A0A3R8SBH6_9BURK|nr:SurA N-terminal domain-containing protein [Aquabacterium soli]RRS05791.1 peptidyl-prolyl cis-trans isomerase [Aquabacterium soli]